LGRQKVIAQQPQITQIFLGDNAGFQATNAESFIWVIKLGENAYQSNLYGLSSWL
jgi:hypothetical protein